MQQVVMFFIAVFFSMLAQAEPVTFVTRDQCSTCFVTVSVEKGKAKILQSTGNAALDTRIAGAVDVQLQSIPNVESLEFADTVIRVKTIDVVTCIAFAREYILLDKFTACAGSYL